MLKDFTNLGPLHTRDWEPVTSTLQALSFVEKAKPVQVHFTLRLRDQRSMWMQDGYKVCMDSYMASIGSLFHGHSDYFQKPPLRGRPNTKPGDHDTLNAHNHQSIPIYRAWRPAWIEIDWNSILLRARSHMTPHYTWGSATTLTWFQRCLGTPFGHFLLGSHKFTVTALGLCVKWP